MKRLSRGGSPQRLSITPRRTEKAGEMHDELSRLHDDRVRWDSTVAQTTESVSFQPLHPQSRSGDPCEAALVIVAGEMLLKLIDDDCLSAEKIAMILDIYPNSPRFWDSRTMPHVSAALRGAV